MGRTGAAPSGRAQPDLPCACGEHARVDPARGEGRARPAQPGDRVPPRAARPRRAGRARRLSTRAARHRRAQPSNRRFEACTLLVRPLAEGVRRISYHGGTEHRMHVIHGSWIPDETDEFTQRGAFYLWVETDTLPGKSRRRAGTVHPRHLMHTALAQFLMEKLGLRESVPGALARTLCTKYFLLPSAAGAPLPSFELLRYVDEEAPAEFELAPWQVCCYRVPQVIPALSDIHFIAFHAAEEFQLGADLLFWYQFTQALKGIIAKDEYIPALKYRALAPSPSKRAKNKPAFELYP